MSSYYLNWEVELEEPPEGPRMNDLRILSRTVIGLFVSNNLFTDFTMFFGFCCTEKQSFEISKSHCVAELKS